MLTLLAALVALPLYAVAHSAPPASAPETWVPDVVIEGDSFFSHFDFLAGQNRVYDYFNMSARANFISQATALETGLAYFTAGNGSHPIAGIKADDWTDAEVEPANSLRIASKMGFTGGLFIFHVDRLPFGCGVEYSITLLDERLVVRSAEDMASRNLTDSESRRRARMLPDAGMAGFRQTAVEGTTFDATSASGCSFDHPERVKTFGLHPAVGHTTDANATVLENDTSAPQFYNYSSSVVATAYGCAGVQEHEDVLSNPDGPGCKVEGYALESSLGNPDWDTVDGAIALLWDSNGVRMWDWARTPIPQDVIDRNPAPSTWGAPAAAYALWEERSKDGCKPELLSRSAIVLSVDQCFDSENPLEGQRCIERCPEIASYPGDSSLYSTSMEFHSVMVYKKDSSSSSGFSLHQGGLWLHLATAAAFVAATTGMFL